MSEPDSNPHEQEDQASKGPNLILMFSLIGLALIAAIGVAIMIVFPFYIRR